MTLCILLRCLSVVNGQELYPIKLSDSFWHNEQRELRYHPEGSDFVITNGNRLFTRALYGTNTAFRVETGDKPEFGLYMPGMGGNLKLGIAAGGQSKWLTNAQTIVARYRPGAMIYTVTDPLLGNGSLNIYVLAMGNAEGIVLRARFEGTTRPVNLMFAFGGASGKKFSRDGDMGADPPDVFDLKPAYCTGNMYTIDGSNFTLRYGAGVQAGQDGRYFVEDAKQTSKVSKVQMLLGVLPAGMVLKIGDAGKLGSPSELYNSVPDKAPVLGGALKIIDNNDYYFAIHNPATKPAMAYSDLPKAFELAETARLKLASRIKIKTPDPYINTVGGALGIAADAIWESPTFLHGSIGWRMRLNGWRGPYAGDELGWHDRAKTHFEAYAKSQLTEPATGPVVADSATHLARSLEKIGVGMFTSGYITRNPNGEKPSAHHYDMNMPYIDELLRHYNWTGDVDFLKQTWPVVKRHLAWETRNFDPDRDGLYDAYAAIWASDALQYSGGGVAHSSAYNYYAFKQAAEIASVLDEDPKPYRAEAEKILTAMNKVLWMQDKGVFAEFKDALGNRLLHTQPGIWTIYHSMDSETMNLFQAYQSVRYIDNEIPHIPVRAKGLDDKGYYTISTTNWMPYTWSLNDVALGESMHAILANYQAGRTDEAFKLFKSEILASMYLGGSPGNFVQISYYSDRERYRDFADGIGMFSRALVEGLFGVVPDALHNSFTIRPGLPGEWNYASFSTPDISFDFKRNGWVDTYTLVQSFPKRLNLKFETLAQGQPKNATVNGKPVVWKNLPQAVGKPVIEIDAPAAEKYVIMIEWQGEKPALPSAEKTYAIGGVLNENIKGATVISVYDPQQVLSNVKTTKGTVTAKINNSEGEHTAFVQLSQGALNWWMPLCFKVEEPMTIIPANGPKENNDAFRLRNNTDAELQVTVDVNGFTPTVNIPQGKTSDLIIIPKGKLVTGTNAVNITLPDGKTETGAIADWDVTTHGKLENIDLSAFFNDKVTQIFKNRYLSPRPQATTLQLPWQGVGEWTGYNETHVIDDSGLRKLAGDKNVITLPQGITFATPGTTTANNIMFTSQWDNYPHEKSIPLQDKASHAWFLMAGSTNPMQSQMENGALVVNYTDGTRDILQLRNPETWWPIEKDYYDDGFAFSLKQVRPIRIHLKTGEIFSAEQSKARFNGKIQYIDGGAATVLDMPLNPSKTLKSITLKTIANDVVIGLMSITLARE
ncbi:hypothetical protein BEL04_16895 [Mucilaginibacter sp. PPCGB 2223]|nr:hypothetical protein BEL04_16895 [Mucilaginibacter sp. PPCGB 2223]